MASMRDIKQRIGNVSSTEQIIKAMDTIASSKLHKARAQLEGVRPIYFALKDQVAKLGMRPEAQQNAFFGPREIKHSLYIILTSDRGFAGAYNAKILQKALDHMKGKNEKILVVGSKGYDYLKRKKKNVIRHVTNVADSQVYYGTENIAKWMTDLYLKGEVDEVFMVYTYFENVLSYIPHVKRMLPIPIVDVSPQDLPFETYEPDINTVIDHTLPLFTHMKLFRAVSESHTSEQAARMVNMSAAGKNASELIEDLTLQFNRERQAAITQELSEIIGGSNI